LNFVSNIIDKHIDKKPNNHQLLVADFKSNGRGFESPIEPFHYFSNKNIQNTVQIYKNQFFLEINPKATNETSGCKFYSCEEPKTRNSKNKNIWHKNSKILKKYNTDIWSLI
jgi:glycosylphosphatidylinositol transamidase (GPIT) subunit GPI8